MTTSKEALKDWISYGYDQEAKYLFLTRSFKSIEPRPYFVSQQEDVDSIRAAILECGDEIIEELNMEVKLLLLNTVR